MEDYAKYNAENVLREVEALINKKEQEIADMKARGYNYISKWTRTYAMRDVYEQLSIFDWWNDRLSISQLKQMRAFLKEAIKLGFTGYVCFKVGASGCANGMWASTVETTDGYSPNYGDVFYRSFTPDYVYYTIRYNIDEVNPEVLTDIIGVPYDGITTIKELNEAIKVARQIVA